MSQLRKIVTIENSVLKFVSTFNETRESLETSHGRQSKKRKKSSDSEPSSKRPRLFSTPDTRQSQSDLVSYLSMLIMGNTALLWSYHFFFDGYFPDFLFIYI